MLKKQPKNKCNQTPGRKGVERKALRVKRKGSICNIFTAFLYLSQCMRVLHLHCPEVRGCCYPTPEQTWARCPEVVLFHLSSISLLLETASDCVLVKNSRTLGCFLALFLKNENSSLGLES